MSTGTSGDSAPGMGCTRRGQGPNTSAPASLRGPCTLCPEPIHGVPARMLQLLGALMSSSVLGSLAWGRGQGPPQLLPRRRTKKTMFQAAGGGLGEVCSEDAGKWTKLSELAQVASTDAVGVGSSRLPAPGKVLLSGCQGPAAPAPGCSGACRRPPVAGWPRRLQGEGSWAPPSSPTRILEGGAWELHL